jgi:hypothetical protein
MRSGPGSLRRDTWAFRGTRSANLLLSDCYVLLRSSYPHAFSADHPPSPAVGGAGAVASDPEPGWPLAQFLAPRLVPQVAADLADFQAYCAEHRVPALPAAPA